MGHPRNNTFGIARRAADGLYNTVKPNGDAVVASAPGASSLSSPASATAAGGGADAFGITSYLVQSLNAGINNGVGVSNDSGANFSASWDGTYARLQWTTAGTAGLRWYFADASHKQAYVRLRVKAFQGVAAVSKILKMLGWGLLQTPQQGYSNFTFGPSMNGYAETAPAAIGFMYSDSASGGDNLTSWYLNGTLGGGGAYSRTPHPTFNVGVAATLSNAETLVEIFAKYNDDGVPNGEFAIWIDGALKTWATGVYNCGAGLQKMGAFGIGEYAGVAGTIEYFRDFAVSAERPVGRGIDLPVFYSDDFESYADAQTLSGTVMNWVNNNPNTIKVSTNFARSGTKSVLFPFKTTANGGQMLELDGDLGANYREVTIEFWVRWPTNFQHIDSPSSDNNKLYRIFPATVPGDRDASYSSVGKLGCSMQLAANANTGCCDISPEWTTVADDSTTGFTARGTSSANFVQPSDYGVWTKIRIYAKAATALGGEGRAVFQVWKNEQLIINERPDNYIASEPRSYRYLYLYGTRNTGDGADPSMDVYLDDIKVWVVA